MSDEFNPPPGAQGTFVCSNNFPTGKRTPNKPSTDYPSVFMMLSEYRYQHSITPKKRRLRETSTTSKRAIRHRYESESSRS